MEINVKETSNSILVVASGTIDSNTTSLFVDKINEIEYGNKDVTLDFNDVTYITSACLRALLMLAKKLVNNKFSIINVNSDVDEVFKMTGFNKIINYSLKRNKDDSFITLFNDRLKQSGDKVICTCFDKEYTWNDLDVASQIIANDLVKQGVKKGSHVGLCAFNSFNWIVTFMAIQKLGGIAVLLNFALKLEEILGLAEIGGVEFLCYGVLSNKEFDVFNNKLQTINNKIKTLNINNETNFLDRKDEFDSIKQLYRELYNCDDPSVIIFTSGSSGKPKAVLASSFNLLVPVNYLIPGFNFNEDDRILAFLPFFHIFGLCSLVIFPLVTNIPIYIPENYKPATLINMIDKYKCTVFHAVPTMMLGVIGDESFDPNKVSSLRVSILGGSVTTEAQMKMFKKVMPNNHFANIYGMSENAIISFTKYEDTIDHVTKTVGLHPDYLDVEIRDLSSNKVLGRNETGEICIRGKTMIVCYYNLDIDKQPIEEDGFLRTGDLGYIDDDGYLLLTGRAKELIIRGGENISPNEVCNALVKLDEIADAKVMGVPDEVFGEEVAAAIRLNTGKTIDDSIRSTLSLTMAKYKIPRYFVILDSFPMLGSGKIDGIKLLEIVKEKIKNNEYI